VVAAQFAFTYLPFMQAVFDTEPIAPLNGLLIIGVGIALLLLVELEKRVSRAFPPEEPSELQTLVIDKKRAWGRFRQPTCGRAEQEFPPASMPIGPHHDGGDLSVGNLRPDYFCRCGA